MVTVRTRPPLIANLDRSVEGTSIQPTDRIPACACVEALGRRVTGIPAVGMLWRRADSNRQPPACKAGALPLELRPRSVLGCDYTAPHSLCPRQ